MEKGEYSSISDFLREAARTHLDRVLLAPEDVSKRAREVQQEEVEGQSAEEVLKRGSNLSQAQEELQELPEEVQEELISGIESPKKRHNSIIKQRGTRISYDRHGDPVHYLKLETSDQDYRAFSQPSGQTVVIVGVRPRDDDAYTNLRDITGRE